MPIKKDDHQDDYYSHVTASQNTSESDKKPLKLKLKAVIKKPSDESKEASIPAEEPVKPAARLVEREHASEGLLRSVMKGSNTPDKSTGDDKKRPVISFKKADTTLKVLENRPVMQVPQEDRYAKRPPRPQ